MSCLGKEELAFLTHVRMTRADTRAATNSLFSVAQQSRERDQALMDKLFVQAPAAITMSDNLVKNAFGTEEQFEEFTKIKTAYNVYHYFESEPFLTEAQRRYPELQKVARVSVMDTKKPMTASTGKTGAESTLSNAKK